MSAFDKIYTTKYKKNGPRGDDVFDEVKNDLEKIIGKNNKISEKEISDLITFLFVIGINFEGQIIKGKILTFTYILNLLTKKYSLDQKSTDLLIKSIQKSEKGRTQRLQWVFNLMEKSHNITQEQRNILKYHKFVYPINKQFHGKKITCSSIITYLKSDSPEYKNMVRYYFQDDEKIEIFTDFVNDNKINLNSEIFKFLIYQIGEDNVGKPLEILKLFDENGYKLSATEILLFIHYVCELGNSHYLSNNEKVKLLENKIIQLTEIFNFLKEIQYNSQHIINDGSLILGGFFLSYVFISGKYKELDKNIAIKCSIIHENDDILKYCLDKKFLASEEEILLLVRSRSNKSEEILRLLMQNGTRINKNIAEVLIFFGYNNELVKLSEISDDEIKELESLRDTINDRYSGLIWKGHKKKEKKMSISVKKNEDTLVHICEENKLIDILSYMYSNDMKMTYKSYMATLYNKNKNVLEYFVKEDNFKPSIFQIMSIPEFETRYLLLKRFYPECIKIDDLFTDTNKEKKRNYNKSEDSDEDGIMKEIKPKKVIKKVVKKD